MNEDILVFDTDLGNSAMIKAELEEAGYKADIALNQEEFLGKTKEKKYDLIIVEPLQLAADNILKFISEQQEKKKFKWIVLTIHADVKTAIDSARMGASDFLSKPYDLDELLITVRNVLSRED